MGRRQPASVGAEEGLSVCAGAGTPFPFIGNCKKCQFSLQMTSQNPPQNGAYFL